MPAYYQIMIELYVPLSQFVIYDQDDSAFDRYIIEKIPAYTISSLYIR